MFPVFELTKKGRPGRVIWNDDWRYALDKIKLFINSEPTLIVPDLTKLFFSNRCKWNRIGMCSTPVVLKVGSASRIPGVRDGSAEYWGSWYFKKKESRIHVIEFSLRIHCIG